MSKSLETVEAQEISVNRKLSNSQKNKNKRVLKSRENIFKPKCSRELKKKLRKYKLRRDGIEDPDILDVSKILVTCLKIKSPNNQDKISCNNNIIEQEELNPGNYLIRMVRKKKIFTEVCEPLVSIINNPSAQKDERCMPILAEEVENKKHTDAFKLMMEARNKSIGSNSPGKEKIEEQESKEIAERREIKAKRNLTLQKMALSKGSLKNKEIEELRDKCIEKKLVKRAERFKEMITKTDSIKSEPKTNNVYGKQCLPVSDKNGLKTKPKTIKSLKLCNIFNDTIEEPKKIPTEDIEFLKKLSPSIKKKENMLSYFQKIPKDDSQEPENNDSVIKVKFNSKRKKKKKILKLTKELHATPQTVEETEKLQTTPETLDDKIVIVDDSKISHIIGQKRIKRKRNLNVKEEVSPSFKINDLNSPNIESRPKRNVKKPLKYTEDVQMFSSDEELHIFTPKKKRNNEKPLKSKTVETTVEIVSMIDSENDIINVVSKDSVSKLSKKDESNNTLKLNKKPASILTKNASNVSSKSIKLSKDKKAVKLAPIFVAKMQLSPADIEAKQKFLQSGVPEKLKKKVQKPTDVITFNVFPSVVHVQQSEADTNLHQEKDWFNDSNTDESCLTQKEHLLKNLLTLEEFCNFSVPVVNTYKPENVLKSIKCTYPKFPVYRTYHLLSGKSKGEFKDCTYPDLDNSIEIINGQCVDVSLENPDQLNWCDKYKPTSSKQIIGNMESIKELKRWLETWTENLFKAKQIDSDSSDFSDFYHSDTDSRDTYRNTNNVLILTGQTGSGKTSCVYAVASELAIKVIEVNASSKRTGKIMLQDLQEATQSHKVDRGRNGSDNSQKLQEEVIIKSNIKKRGRPRKLNGKHSTDTKSKQPSLKTSESQSQTLASQEIVRTGMSLILIDDADIIFDQDDGFCSAIAQLIQSSKRPVILVTSSLTCPHLQRFLQYGKVLHMRPVLSRMLGTWLDIMCLADMGKCCTGLGAKLLDFYRGDIRKTINCLQFYMNSNKHINQGEEVALSQLKHNIDDEDSSMSWLDSESLDAPISNDKEVDSYIDKQLQALHFGCALDVFNIWWNLPKLYKDCNNAEVKDSEQIERPTKVNCNQEQDRLNRIANVLDTISAIDYFDHNNPDTGTNISTRPWYSSENDSLLENENFECYNNSSLLTAEISSILIKSTIKEAQRVFKCKHSLDFPTLSMNEQRNRDKIVNRHNTLSSYLPSSAVLDRRATALDYWPTCRTICRIEKTRPDSNLKRNNRFCHYLKSLNILGKNDFFDSLADSLT